VGDFLPEACARSFHNRTKKSPDQPQIYVVNLDREQRTHLPRLRSSYSSIEMATQTISQFSTLCLLNTSKENASRLRITRALLRPGRNSSRTYSRPAACSPLSSWPKLQGPISPPQPFALRSRGAGARSIFIQTAITPNSDVSRLDCRCCVGSLQFSRPLNFFPTTLFYHKASRHHFLSISRRARHCRHPILPL